MTIGINENKSPQNGQYYIPQYTITLQEQNNEKTLKYNNFQSIETKLIQLNLVSNRIEVIETNDFCD